MRQGFDVVSPKIGFVGFNGKSQRFFAGMPDVPAGFAVGVDNHALFGPVGKILKQFLQLGNRFVID